MIASRVLERWIRAISIVLWDGRLITLKVECRHVRKRAARRSVAGRPAA